MAAASSPNSPLVYSLDVLVNPDDHYLECTAVIQNPPEACFYLHKHLAIRQILADGKPVAFHCDSSQTLVSPGDTAVLLDQLPQSELRIEYAGRFLPAVLPPILDLVSIVRSDLVELAFYSVWYPRFKSQTSAAFSLSINLPADFTPVTNGLLQRTDTIQTESGQERTCSHWNSLAPGFDIVLIAAPHLEKYTLHHDQTQVELYYHQLPPDYVQAMAQRLITTTQRFSQFYGALSNHTLLRLIYSPRDAWGYARSPAIIVSEQYALNQLSDPLGPANDFHYAAHELAHFWWGIANMNTPNDWINEGLAEFSAFRIAEEIFGPDYAAQRIAAYLQHVRAAKTSTAIADTTADLPDRETNRYDKPALLFISARQQFGQESLDRFLRSLYTRFSTNRDASTSAFLYELHSKLGLEAKYFFTEFLFNPGWDDSLLKMLSLPS